VTVPRLIEISEYWAKVPPMHEVVAGFLGATKPGASPASPASPADEATASHDDLIQQLLASGFTLPAGV
jgi:hypothetical protein